MDLDDDFGELSDTDLLAEFDDAKTSASKKGSGPTGSGGTSTAKANVQLDSGKVRSSENLEIISANYFLKLQAQLDVLRQKLAEAEASRDLHLGEVAILRSNMTKSSQVHTSQLRDVRQTQNVEKLEYEHELERLNAELETLRTEKAFFQNDLLTLRNNNVNLEKKLNQAQAISATQVSSKGQQRLSVEPELPDAADNNDFSDSPKPQTDSPKKRARAAIQESFMDGFSLAFPSPSKKARANESPTRNKTSKRNMQNRLLTIGSSSEKSTARPPPSSSPQQPVESMENENNEIDMEDLRMDVARGWTEAGKKQANLEFIDVILTHKLMGTRESSFDYLGRFSLGDQGSISKMVKDGLLHYDPNYESLSKFTEYFGLMSLDAIKYCIQEEGTQRSLTRAVPVLLLLLYQTIEFDSEMKCGKLCLESLPKVIKVYMEEIVEFSGNSTIDEYDQSMPLQPILKAYSVLYILEIMEYISCAAVQNSFSSQMWSLINNDIFSLLLQLSTPVTILIKTVNLLISSITKESIGSLDYGFEHLGGDQDEEGNEQYKEQKKNLHESELLKSLSLFLVEDPKPSPLSVFGAIDNSVPFQYILFSNFQNMAGDKTWSNSSFNISAWYMNTTDSKLEKLHRSQTIYLRRCVIKTLILFLTGNRGDPHRLLGYSFPVEAVIHCLSFELDKIYSAIPTTTFSSIQESIALISDCVKLLHAMWVLKPDILARIANLSGSTPHEHIVSLARIHFSDPPSPMSPLNQYKKDDMEVGNIYTGQACIYFDPDVTQKARDLLENSVTLQEAEDLFASMS